MSETVVLDSSAVLAFLLGEAESDEVEEMFEGAQKTDTQHLMTAVNWGEVLYVMARRLAHEDVLPVVSAFEQLPIAVVDAGRDLALEAARLKLVHHIGFADAFAAALAIAADAPLLTKDADFDSLEADGLTVRHLS